MASHISSSTNCPAARGTGLTSSPTVLRKKTRLPSLLVSALLLSLALFYTLSAEAQSGRNKKQPTPTPTGTLRPKPTQTPTVTVTAPPPAPTPSPDKQEKPASTSSDPSSEIIEVDPDDVVRVDANLVTIPASVVDAQGKAVIDLKLEDFELRVEGQRKEITELSHAETPVRMVLLFDNSMSLRESREFEKQAAVKFLQRVMRPIDQAAIFSIYTYPILAQTFTSDVPLLVRTIENFPVPEDGATALLDTVVKASDYLKKYEGRKVIVIVSDGADTISEMQDFDVVLQRALAADCQIYAVQTGQSESANLFNLTAYRRLQEFASQTGGAVYVPKSTRDMDTAFAQIAADLSQQYVLSYYPNDDKRDGRFRAISLRVPARPNLRVRARKGYYPPKG